MMKFTRLVVSVFILPMSYAVFMISGCSQNLDHDHVPEQEAQQTTAEDHEPHEAETGISAVVTVHDEAGHDPAVYEGLIELDTRTMEIIGLKTITVQLTDFDDVIEATGKIINNANNEAHIGSLIPGRINELLADPGESVSKGQELACIESILN